MRYSGIGYKTAALFFVGQLMVGCPVDPPIGDGDTAFVISDPSTPHWMHGTDAKGNTFDCWTSDGFSPNDFRIGSSSGKSIYLQVDSTGRPSWMKEAGGGSLRVHSYLTNGKQDVTIQDKNGKSSRYEMNISQYLKAWPSYQKNGTSEQDLDEPYSVQKDFNSRCQGPLIWEDWLGSTESITDTLAVISCLADIVTDDSTLPTDDELARCAANYTDAGTVQELVSDAREWLDRRDGNCSDFEECTDSCGFPIEETPTGPPETGTEELGSGDVRVTLTWDTGDTDLDLYVTDPEGESIYFSAPLSSSGGQLDVDDQDGFGPENIFWPSGAAPAGQYSVAVNYFSGVGGANYTVQIIHRGPEGPITETFSGYVDVNSNWDNVASFVLN